MPPHFDLPQEIRSLLFDDYPACHTALGNLLEHPFGNYVLKTLLARLEPTPASYEESLNIAAVRKATKLSNYGRSDL